MENIKPNHTKNFELKRPADLYDAPYNYRSVMHYGAYVSYV